MAIKSFKGVQTDIDILSVIFAISTVPGSKYSQAEMAEYVGVSKRTIEAATKRLEAAGVISREYGRGRRSYVYQFSGVYLGRFDVRVFPHPCVRNYIVICTPHQSESYPVMPYIDSRVANFVENLRLYG